MLAASFGLSCPGEFPSGKVWLLKLAKPHFGHRLKGELPLLAGSELKPRQPLLHFIDPGAQA